MSFVRVCAALLLTMLVVGCVSVAGESPTPLGSAAPSTAPGASATIEPTDPPMVTATPSATATEAPTDEPTGAPTPSPTTAATAQPTPTPPPTPEPTPRPARIRTFEVSGGNTVDCSVEPEPYQIRLEWDIARGTGVTISIDGPGIYSSYEGRTGFADVPFSCGESEHRYTLRTTGGVGEPDRKTIIVRRAEP